MGVTFDTGQSALKPQSDAVLKEMVKLLADNPTWKMRIEGHTDNVGTKALKRRPLYSAIGSGRDVVGLARGWTARD